MLPILLVHETTNYRLLRYSIIGRDKVPISQENIVYKTITNRLLRYSTFEWETFPIS